MTEEERNNPIAVDFEVLAENKERAGKFAFSIQEIHCGFRITDASFLAYSKRARLVRFFVPDNFEEIPLFFFISTISPSEHLPSLTVRYDK